MTSFVPAVTDFEQKIVDSQEKRKGRFQSHERNGFKRIKANRCLVLLHSMLEKSDGTNIAKKILKMIRSMQKSDQGRLLRLGRQSEPSKVFFKLLVPWTDPEVPSDEDLVTVFSVFSNPR